jgi:hypothetical protein
MSMISGDGMKTNEETRVAEEIVSVLPAGVARLCSDDRESIRYAVRGLGLKLRSVVFSRAALRTLLSDPVGKVKIEYLQRDLLRSAPRRAEYEYPRKSRIIKAEGRRQKAEAVDFRLLTSAF